MACCGVFVATLVMNAEHAADPVAAQPGNAPRFGADAPTDCGGEPCDAVVRGSPRSSTAVRMVWMATGARAPTATWRPTVSSCRRANVEARFRFLQLRRRWDPNADDPLFRPIDADDFRTNGENAAISATSGRTVSIRIVFPLPSNIRLIDPATNRPSSETFVDVWRAVPTVNDVALTGPDGTTPGRAVPNTTGGYQLDARVRRFRSRRSARFINHAQIQRRAAATGSSTTSPPSSACCSRTIVFGRSRMP